MNTLNHWSCCLCILRENLWSGRLPGVVTEKLFRWHTKKKTYPYFLDECVCNNVRFRGRCVSRPHELLWLLLLLLNSAELSKWFVFIQRSYVTFIVFHTASNTHRPRMWWFSSYCWRFCCSCFFSVCRVTICVSNAQRCYDLMILCEESVATCYLHW